MIETSIETQLQRDISEVLSAGFTGIWLRSFEYSEADSDIEKVCDKHQWPLHRWDAYNQFTPSDMLDCASVDDDDPLSESKRNQQANIPAAAIKEVVTASTRSGGDVKHVLLIPNMHLYITKHKILDLQALQNAMVPGIKQDVAFIGLVPPEASVPLEVEKQMLVVDHELPTSEELWFLAQELVNDVNKDRETDENYSPESQIKLPEGDEKRLLLEASAGFTRYEFANAASLSIVRHHKIITDELWEIKEQLLKKSGLLELTRSKQGFDAVGGFENLKEHLTQFFNSPNAKEEGVQARGVVLLGVSGTGKSMIAKCLGHEVNRPVLSLDVGKLMGSLVGQTEERTRLALRLADAMSPCILFVDKLCPVAA